MPGSWAVENDLWIGDWGGANPRLLPDLVNLKLSWEVNTAGLLTCELPKVDFERVGFSLLELGGKWVTYLPRLATLRWSGAITGVALSNGMVTIAAESFHTMLRKKLVTVSQGEGEAVTGKPGTMMRLLLAEADPPPRKWGLRVGAIDSGGEDIAVFLEDADLYDDGIPAVTSDVGWEWEATPERVVNHGPRLGRDKSASVVLVEGRHIVAASWAEDGARIENLLSATGTAKVRKRRGKPKVERAISYGPVGDQASIQRWGVREGVRDYGRVANQDSLKARLEADLKRSANPPAAVTLDLANEDDVWGAFREGDDVQVQLPLSGVPAAKLRVQVRSLDAASGMMTIAGDATGDFRVGGWCFARSVP